MKTTEPKHTYTFVNPNTPKEFEQILKRILIDKLLSFRTDTSPKVR